MGSKNTAPGIADNIKTTQIDTEALSQVLSLLSLFPTSRRDEPRSSRERFETAFTRLNATPAALGVKSRRSSRLSNRSRNSSASNQSGVFKSKQFDESEEAVQQLIEKSRKRENEHVVHVEWLARIDALWHALKSLKAYDDERRLKNAIREKRKLLDRAKEEVEHESMLLESQMRREQKSMNKAMMQYRSQQTIL
jgi:hypothetical protein